MIRLAALRDRVSDYFSGQPLWADAAQYASGSAAYHRVYPRALNLICIRLDYPITRRRRRDLWIG